MKFTVTWTSSAEADLTAIWLEAAREDRPYITAAVHLADQTLKFNPESAGESRSQGERIVFVRPLVLTFEIREADRVVAITEVRRARGKQ